MDIQKKEIVRAKGSTPFLIASIIAFVFSAVLMVVSAISMGIGYIKSEIDGEYIATFYDVHRNEYDDLYDVPLYDKQGNIYILMNTPGLQQALYRSKRKIL